MVLRGIEPRLSPLQEDALPTELKNHKYYCNNIFYEFLLIVFKFKNSMGDPGVAPGKAIAIGVTAR